MAVTITQSQTYDGGYTNTHTFPDVDASGTDTLHIACGFNRNPATEVTSWTSETNAMTAIKDEINANVCAVSTWRYLINNAATTTVSTTPSYKLQSGITLGLAGVDQTTPITGTPVSSGGYGTSATQAYTGTSGNLLFVFLGLKDDRTITASSCTEQTFVTGSDGNMGTGWCGYATATGSSQTIGGTWTTDTNWTMVIFEVKAASGSTAYDVVAAVGAFTLTGQSAGLSHGTKVSSDAGSLALTGQDAGLSFGTGITNDSGAFALTGQDANLSHATIMALEAGALTLTGNDVSFTSGYVLGCDPGSYTLTGNDATFNLGLTMTADPGTFALTGQDTGLSYGVTLNSETGAFVLTGQDAGLSTQYVVLTETGGFLLTGKDAALTFSQIMSAETGAYTLAGNDAALPIAYKINPETGTFTLTGNNVNLNFSSPSGAGNIIIGIAI